MFHHRLVFAQSFPEKVIPSPPGLVSRDLQLSSAKWGNIKTNTTRIQPNRHRFNYPRHRRKRRRSRRPLYELTRTLRLLTRRLKSHADAAPGIVVHLHGNALVSSDDFWAGGGGVRADGASVEGKQVRESVPPTSFSVSFAYHSITRVHPQSFVGEGGNCKTLAPHVSFRPATQPFHPHICMHMYSTLGRKELERRQKKEEVRRHHCPVNVP